MSSDSTTKVLALVGGATLVAAAALGVKHVLDRSGRSSTEARVAELERKLQEAQQREATFSYIVNKLKGDSPAAGAEDAAAAEAGEKDRAAVGAEQTAVVPKKPASGRQIRIYIDGCFDMMHFGHSNALRQARAVGDVLVVGLISDEEIIAHKGSRPVMPYDERRVALSSCKFVDEVIDNAPYELTPEWTHTLVDKYHIDYIVHGDDPCLTADGKDAYATAKKMGIFKTIKRTEGISTTDIVGRMLLMSRAHHVRHLDGDDERAVARKRIQYVRERSSSQDLSENASISQFLPTSRRIIQFADGKAPKEGDVVVYCAGAWDLFNAGHCLFLEKARQLGDFLLVGIHDDDTVNKQRGGGFPVLNLHERTLSVLSCRFVDEVIIGAPWVISKDMITSMNIQVVVHGTVSDADVLVSDSKESLGDSYTVPREMGILKVVDSPSPITALSVLQRVLDDRAAYQARYEKKAAKERAYYESDKVYVAEA